MEGTAVIQKFRSALGGFNRQDVQQYIEQTAAVHRQDLEALQQRLDQAEDRAAQLEAALSGAENAKSGAAAEEAKARACLEESTRTLARLRGELSQLAVAKQELSRLQTQVGKLEPMADSYVQLKDRVATVELDAHRKAQDTVSQAQAEAERIRTETRSWLEGVLAQYGTLRQGMDGLLEQVKLLSRGSERLGALDDAARALRERGGLE